jgi:hypothetical protein
MLDIMESYSSVAYNITRNQLIRLSWYPSSSYVALVTSRKPHILYQSISLPQTSTISCVTKTLADKHNSAGHDNALRMDSEASYSKGTAVPVLSNARCREEL